MSLDSEQIYQLKAKSFDKLYTDHAAKWAAMVQEARKYSQSCVGDGQMVRLGDIVNAVQLAIRLDPTYQKHINDKRLTQKYWVELFAEYIVDAVYPQQV